MAINPMFAEFLEGEPRAAFFGTIGREQKHAPRGFYLGTPARRRQAQQIYSDALSEFYGQLGEQILGGGEPTLKFTDFVENKFPYTERFAQMGRQFSPVGSKFRPRTRHLYF